MRRNKVALKEKIGQLLLVGFKGQAVHREDAIARSILTGRIGGVVLFDYDFQTKTHVHNIESPSQLKQLTSTLQRFAGKTPLFIGIDYEGGYVNRLKAQYGFPKTVAAADIATCSQEEAAHEAARMAKTLQSVGVNLNFAPVLDVNVNAESPAIGKLGRSFSNDPLQVVRYAKLLTDAFQAAGVLCAYKHFPGHGSARGDTHKGLVDVTETWQPEELLPYKTLIPGLTHGMIMTSHVVHLGLDSAGYPASLSRAMTQDLLREQLHFDGVVITDDLQMQAIADHYTTEETMRLAINAGADILLFGNQLSKYEVDPLQLIEQIAADIAAGFISEKRIEESYRRVMKLKEKLR
ncbi:MAG: hypothetical protein A3F14_02875 [Gammaproteobacteria bacterium RIFCSPHIGHO2_12_FULL_43_28]|nr:MAG: hypothetical protein A3F14_02875 [Gammaproteobacteria bacterium RIFCSPHIGHO2_12_FULL_43_28]